jgi:hypothetical protein
VAKQKALYADMTDFSAMTANDWAEMADYLLVEVCLDPDEKKVVCITGVVDASNAIAVGKNKTKGGVKDLVLASQDVEEERLELEEEFEEERLELEEETAALKEELAAARKEAEVAVLKKTVAIESAALVYLPLKTKPMMIIL